jgi:SHS2 domain-containing protein
MFEILEHPSDAGILARGRTREEALVEASRGLTSIIVNSYGIEPREERLFRASGSDDGAQIVDWLNEILFFFDTEGMVLVDFAIDSWTDREIVGRAQGNFYDPARDELRTAVKAVTYHQFQSHETPDGWEIRVFVDL